MPTLNSVFKLFDEYSSPLDKINRKTDQATNKILNASGSADKFNAKLSASGASAGNAVNGINKFTNLTNKSAVAMRLAAKYRSEGMSKSDALSKAWDEVGRNLKKFGNNVGSNVNTANNSLRNFLSLTALLAAAIKGMKISDEYINTNARLELINDGLQTQAELQEKVFQAADRSKGSYSTMAAAISKMGITASEAFKNNDELIAFTELVQKGFKVGGASTMEQQSGMLQLTQAMGAGKLQGDEFRSIMENAPMVADAIAKYMGKSKGELKKLSSDGVITADIIKNALFMSADSINAKFKKMPMTFADVWNKIKNGATKAFGGLMLKVNKLINTPQFAKFIDNLIVGFNLIANAAGWLIDVMINGWSVVGPILAFIGGVLLAAILIKIIQTTAALISQAAAWIATYWPVVLIIAIIVAAIAIARHFGATWSDIFGFVGGVIGLFAAGAYNSFVIIWNAVAAFINFFGNAFRSPIASIKALFFDLASNVIGFVKTMAQAIQDLLNKIPGVNINITGGLENLQNKLKNASATIKSKAELVEYVKSKDFMSMSEGYTKGSSIGKNTLNGLSNLNNKLSGLLAGSSPVAVKGLGNGGKVKVDMSNEDLQYLRDIAEREYINKFSTATLAPNIQVSFGDVHQEADVNKVLGRIRTIMQEEIAVAAEGVY